VAAAVVAAKPDVLILIDSPDFNLRVARRVRRADPAIPIVDYVAPTVWAWRPARAPAMAAFVDRVLAVLPFEPAAMARLKGPPTTYVGHPLIERLSDLRPAPGERLPLAARATLLVLPGSRRSEIGRLLAPFGETIALARKSAGDFDLILPAVPWLLDEIRAGVEAWQVKPVIVSGEPAKLAAFRRAHAALAASGTVTLELALAGVPTVIAYRTDTLAKALRPMIERQWSGPVEAMGLANLILADMASPEFLNAATEPAAMAAALTPLLAETPERQRQVEAFRRLETLMAIDGGTPSGRAAETVLDTVRDKRAQRAAAGT
jgi:lipid-A-disaccharide synthase